MKNSKNGVEKSSIKIYNKYNMDTNMVDNDVLEWLGMSKEEIANSTEKPMSIKHSKYTGNEPKFVNSKPKLKTKTITEKFNEVDKNFQRFWDDYEPFIVCGIFVLLITIEIFAIISHYPVLFLIIGGIILSLVIGYMPEKRVRSRTEQEKKSTQHLTKEENVQVSVCGRDFPLNQEINWVTVYERYKKYRIHRFQLIFIVIDGEVLAKCNGGNIIIPAKDICTWKVFKDDNNQWEEYRDVDKVQKFLEQVGEKVSNDNCDDYDDNDDYEYYDDYDDDEYENRYRLGFGIIF